MFMRVDKLQIELPPPVQPDPHAAGALQELLGGKYGEMSTLGNYSLLGFTAPEKKRARFSAGSELVVGLTRVVCRGGDGPRGCRV